MSTNTIEPQETKETAAPKRRPAVKTAKAAKKSPRTKKPKADRANKKAEVIAMMKRAKGATAMSQAVPRPR
jgi:hypothetical protein